MTLPYELRIYNLKRNDKYEFKKEVAVSGNLLGLI